MKKYYTGFKYLVDTETPSLLYPVQRCFYVLGICVYRSYIKFVKSKTKIKWN